MTVKNYPSISAIEDKVAPHLGTMTSKKESERTLEQPGHKKVYDDKDISIYHLTDEDVSKNLYGGGHQRGGTGTSWCTAARSEANQFDNYAAEGPMHIIHRKSDGAVFQIHPDSGQFQDAKNNQISSKDFESIRPAFHKALRATKDLTE